MENSIDNRAYAGFFVRMIAYIIDSIIAFIAAGLIKLPFGLAAGAGLSSLKANFIFQHSFIDVVGYIGMVGYFILMTYFTHSTLGKMLFRLEVVTEDGDWKFINILYRETVGRFLSGIMNIGYLAVIISQTRQGFHDMLCDTYVVYRGMENAGRPARTDATVAAGGAAGDHVDVTVNAEPDVRTIMAPDGMTNNVETQTVATPEAVASNVETPNVKPEESQPVNSAFIMPVGNDANKVD